MIIASLLPVRLFAYGKLLEKPQNTIDNHSYSYIVIPKPLYTGYIAMNRRVQFAPEHHTSESIPSSLFRKRIFLTVALATLIVTVSLLDLTVTTYTDFAFASALYTLLSLVGYQWLTLNADNEHLLAHQCRSNQIVCASVMAAIPGCGGMVSVMSQFVSGKLGIGALIAALISTLGNAAFLFIASDVSTSIAAIALSVIVGSALGKIINLSHVDDLLRPTKL